MPAFKSSLCISLALSLSSCHTLACRTEPLTPFYLASEQINTPDPRRECFEGEQLVIHWNLPKRCLTHPIEAILHIRYGNRQVETYTHPVDLPLGYWIFRLLNEEYALRGGILSYRVELTQEGRVLAHWNHHLWVDLINLS